MSAEDSKPAAGWYDDPAGDIRWWDGNEWTDEVRISEMPAGPSGTGLGWRGWLLLTGFAAAAIWAGQLLWATR